jgi:anti-sigma factor RsiW
MSCSEFDWKAYVLEELAPGDRTRAREHAAVCPHCAEELERLQLTRVLLRAVPEEEMPRRLAFVSDKVFEPNWWQRFWASAPRLGFASAAMLSVAILVSAYLRPGPAPARANPQPDRAQVAALVEKEVAKRLPVLVQAAVDDANHRNQERTKDLLASAERRLEFEHRAEMLAVQDNLTILRRQLNQAYVASNAPAGSEGQ